jgi:mRNA-degrading endonuclease RelE of RelBE toxin-antitoxin system
VTKVHLSIQVENFLKSLAPEPRRRMRDALKGLEKSQGDIRSLEQELTVFCRLRVGRYRVGLHYVPGRNGPECFCDYAESRNVIYEHFAALLNTPDQ